MENNFDRRNKFCFGFGTIGRDMFYTMVSMFIMVYITEVLIVPDATLAIMTTLLFAMRIFDAFNDPIMGLIVDNTRTRFGKFKPGMLLGGTAASICMLLLFLDMGLSGIAYAVVFTVCYLLWDISYGLNDVAYWSMMPALSTDQKERERIGSFARICANIGMFAVVVGIIPVTNALGTAAGSMRVGWFWFALIVVALMLGFQGITLIGVKEHKGYFKEEGSTSLREMFSVILKNDQLLWVAVSMSLYMIGYTTTTSFGVHFFKYAYGDEQMYAVFAVVLGVSQLTALGVFPLFSRRYTRRKLYTFATILVVAGYILFFIAPMHILFIGVAGVLIFVGQGFIQILMLMFLADSIEYGQWKLGKRNESITFSVQPLINKIGGAIASGVLGFTLIISGINAAVTPADVPAGGITVMKVFMLLLPLATILAGYIINMRKFKIDETRFTQIVDDLHKRGDLGEAD